MNIDGSGINVRRVRTLEIHFTFIRETFGKTSNIVNPIH